MPWMIVRADGTREPEEFRLVGDARERLVGRAGEPDLIGATVERTPPVYKVRCRDCGLMKPEEEIHSASRFGGGNYRRPGRMILSSICEECVLDLVQYMQASDHLVSRWSKPTIARLAAEIEARRGGIGPRSDAAEA